MVINDLVEAELYPSNGSLLTRPRCRFNVLAHSLAQKAMVEDYTDLVHIPYPR